MQSTDGLLQRKPQASQLQTSLNEDNNMTYHDVDLSKPIPSSAIYGKNVTEDGKGVARMDWIIMAAIFAIALALRFYRLDHPNSVVFDEVHFGKFASFYLRREFFFDVHPPLAKLILAAAGWLIGYDGHFDFDNIGDMYLANNVPYIGLRSFPVVIGSLVPVVVYAIMRESGYPAVVGLFSTALVLLDNAHVLQTRLILLDAPLILFMAISFYCYIRFYKLRYSEFTKPWWTWMMLTGIFLSLTISCKMVGLFAFMTVGTAVVVDLWNLLDIKRGHSIDHVFKHFAARVLGLIIVPAIVYLFWFWVHFTILNKSGTGDDFMSSAFQQTLRDSPLMLNSEEIRYYDKLIIQHKGTKAFLHSHLDRYPLKYDDGRVSSAGQQVTGYPFNDTNNEWIVYPTKELPDTGRGRVVRHDDVIKLVHVNTNTSLMTHDVACPLMATNTEFTTWPVNPAEPTSEEETHFILSIDGAHDGSQWMSKSSHFQLIHVITRVAMWTKIDPLPDWGLKQQEINGNKNLKDKTTFWVVDSILHDPNITDRARPPAVPKEIGSMNFFAKFFELQIAMLRSNAGLTDSHPYATGPLNWPFLASGISFWTGPAEELEQVYLIGNIIGWWICVMTLALFIGMIGADQFAQRRGLHPIAEPIRNRLYNSGGFFMLAWIYHYVPFFSMSRQLFLHHYLPAHLCSALVAGAVFHFALSESINYPISIATSRTRRRPSERARTNKKMVGVLVGTIVALAAMYVFMMPLTYGTPGLDPDAVNRRRLFSSWTLHYAK